LFNTDKRLPDRTYDVSIVSLLENITLEVDETLGEAEVLGNLGPVLLGGVLGEGHVEYARIERR